MSFDMFDICAGGMHAQRVKMDTISSNIANANTTRNAKGEREVYVKKEVSFQAIYKDKLALPALNSTKTLNMDGIDGPYLRGSINTGSGALPTQGVMVSSIDEAKDPYRVVYDPSHPDADEQGFLKLPNVNVVEEMVNMVNASKAYEANAAIASTAKTMMQAAMGI